MKTDTFTAAPKLDEIGFDNPFNVDDVQIYFCHHVLRLVVFGKGCRADIQTEPQGWILRLHTTEERHIPFSDTIEIPVIGISIDALNATLQRALEEPVQRVKVEQKDIYERAKREVAQQLKKSSLCVQLLHPITKAHLHCFWAGENYVLHHQTESVTC